MYQSQTLSFDPVSYQYCNAARGQTAIAGQSKQAQRGRDGDLRLCNLRQRRSEVDRPEDDHPWGRGEDIEEDLHVDTAETTTTTQYDKFTVKVGGTTVATFSNLNAASGYVLHSINLTGLSRGEG